MKDEQLIRQIRCGKCTGCQVECEGDSMLPHLAADRIEELIGELRDERHRHDRYVDFELAQAEELRTLREQNRWIPVEERLPDKEWIAFGEETGEELEVLAKVEYARVACALYYDGHDGFYDYGIGEEKIYYPVTHWRPMPDLPEGKAGRRDNNVER